MHTVVPYNVISKFQSMQVIKKLLIISDSMLRFQGKAGSRLGSGHFCSVHAFGGALCSEITGNILDICEKTTKGYYDRVIVMAVRSLIISR